MTADALPRIAEALARVQEHGALVRDLEALRSRLINVAAYAMHQAYEGANLPDVPRALMPEVFAARVRAELDRPQAPDRHAALTLARRRADTAAAVLASALAQAAALSDARSAHARAAQEADALIRTLKETTR